jgi:hypothetical protein
MEATPQFDITPLVEGIVNFCGITSSALHLPVFISLIFDYKMKGASEKNAV